VSFGSFLYSDNAYAEAFNVRVRAECLDQSSFLDLDDARSKIGAWRRQYNESRPHSALGWLTPREFALAAVRKAAE
jgi:putative transposase